MLLECDRVLEQAAREIVESPLLILKLCLDTILHYQGGWARWSPEVISNPNPSVILCELKFITNQR